MKDRSRFLIFIGRRMVCDKFLFFGKLCKLILWNSVCKTKYRYYFSIHKYNTKLCNYYFGKRYLILSVIEEIFNQSDSS